MPSPSVTLWIMKPTIRNVRARAARTRRSCRSPGPRRSCAARFPVRRAARARGPSPPTSRRAARYERHRQVAERDAEDDQAGTAECARKGRLQLERLEQRLDAQKRQQPAGERHERGQPALVGPAQRRQPQEAERDRDDADEEADQPVAEEPTRRRPGGLDGRRDLLDRLDPGRTRRRPRSGRPRPSRRARRWSSSAGGRGSPGPSRVYGTIASSTVTDATVRSSRAIGSSPTRISPGRNSTRRTSNSSAGAGFRPISSTTTSRWP